MYDYKYSDLYNMDSIDKQLHIAYDNGTITNKEIHSEQFVLTESICSQSQLLFGCCESSSIEFKISNIMESLKEKWLTVTETIGGNTDVPFSFGKYKAYSDIPTADRRYRNVKAYDAMYDIINADVADWYNTVLPKEDSQVTLKQFRDSFFSHFDIEQETVTLANDNMIVKKTVQPSSISGKDVITAICEINGCFGHIGRNGKFQYIFLEKSFDDVSKTGKYINCQYEDYVSNAINKLQIRQEENDAGVIYGTGNNMYVVEDNFLVYGKSASEMNVVAKNLYSVISGISYRPFSTQLRGNPCVEVGDRIKLETTYKTIESYILSRTLTGVQGLRDNFSTQGDEFYSENVNSVQKSIIQLKGRTNTLERNIDETKSTITDVEKGLQTQITQNAESIETEVSRATKKETEIEGNLNSVNEDLSSRITQTAESITTEVTKKIEDETKRATEAESGLSGSLTTTREELTSKIEQTAEDIGIRVTATETSVQNISKDLSGVKTKTQLAIDINNGLAMLVNHDGVKPNDGEIHFCKRDPESGILEEAKGWVMWQGEKRDVQNQNINPNRICPFNLLIYMVLRLTSVSATSGTIYLVWYEDEWKYADTPTPSAVLGTWTWNNDTDIVLGQFVEPSSEGAFVDTYLYTPCKSYQEISSNYALNSYSTTTEMNSAINVAKNEISLSVSETYTTKNEFTGLSTTVSQHTSQIQQNSEQIALKVSSTDYTGEKIASLINQTASTVKIQAKHIQLDGDTTIGSGFVLSAENIKSNAITTDKLSANAVTTPKLATDAIKSINYSYTGGNFSTTGSFLDLANGEIRTPNFYSGNTGAYFSGNVYANSGTIGGFSIKNNSLHSIFSYRNDIDYPVDGGTEINYGSVDAFGNSYAPYILFYGYGSNTRYETNALIKVGGGSQNSMGISAFDYLSLSMSNKQTSEETSIKLWQNNIDIEAQNGMDIDASVVNIKGNLALFGELQFHTGTRTEAPLKAWEGDKNGFGIAIGAGGRTVIGGGESANSLKNNVYAGSGTTEELDLASDNNIRFLTKCNTIGNRVEVLLDTSRNFYPVYGGTSGAGSIGTNSNRWGSGYFNDLIVGDSGSIVGSIKILSITSYHVSGTVAANSSSAFTATITNTSGATNKIAIPYRWEWGNISNVSISGTTLSVTLLNTTTASHSCEAYIYVVQYTNF